MDPASGELLLTREEADGFPGAEALDVLNLGFTGTPRLDTNVYEAGVQSVPVPGIRFVTGYFGQ